MKKLAFTLAEVLITLGIIGVVAAMTIPTLVTNADKKATATKLKVFYSKINQAVKLSSAYNDLMVGNIHKVLTITLNMKSLLIHILHRI